MEDAKEEEAMRYSEISHSISHPHHRLRFDSSELPFKCDGCKEVGIGSRYKCSLCDFDLHVQCALPSPTITHPFYTKCSFQFLSAPPGNTERYCNACEKDVSGFVYHCRSCGFDLHPCCAKLPMVLNDGEINLYLYRKVGSSCNRCGRKGRSWSYRSACKKYSLHVACVREMLVESWSEVYAYGNGTSGGGKEVKAATGKNRHSVGRIPNLKNTLINPQKKSKGIKCSDVAGFALQFVVSAVLGDPTTLIAGLIGSLL